MYSDSEDFYDAIVLSSPPRKLRGKATVENRVRYRERLLIEPINEKTYMSLEDISGYKRKSIVSQLRNGTY